MLLETIQEIFSPKIEEQNDQTPPVPPTDLIYDDGEPLETNRHRLAMNVLIDSLQQAWSDRNDFYAGGNMFMYYNANKLRNQDFRGPDFFAVLGVDGTIMRKSWTVWDEGGRYPNIIVELTSPSTENVDKTIKKELYSRIFKTRNYFTFDPYVPTSLSGWILNDTFDYLPLVPNERGWLWSTALGLWLGTWTGTINRETADWLRFYDQSGNLQLLSNEAAQMEADQEKQRADQEKQRADQEKQRADQEKQRADRIAAKLRALGLDPED